MAVEGGSSYRDRLVKREQNKKNLIDLRKRQSENPMEWVNQLRRGEAEQAYESYAKTAASMGLSPEAYGAFIDAAFQGGANMEGIINPTPTKTTFNISNARALEGMKKAGAEGLGIAEVAGRPGSVDVMYKYGQSYYPVPQESFTESLNNMAKFIKDNPRLSAEMSALAALTSFGRILGTGKSMGADLEAGKGNIGGYGIRRGAAMAYDAENVMGQKAGVGDYADVFSYFVPGVGFSKPVTLAAKAVKGVPTAIPTKGFSALGRAVRDQASRFAGRGDMPTVTLGDIGGAQGRMSLEEAQPLLEQVPLATKRSGRGTPRRQQTQAQAEVLSSKQKLKAEAETNQGKRLTYNLRHILFDRVKEIDKRAKDISPDANELKPKKGDKKAYVIYTREMKRLLRDAERDFPGFNLDELELSHITPLTQGGRNTWSNLRLMPRQLNQDQGTALYSAWRYASMGLLDPSKVAKGTPLGGARGSAAITGRLAEGIG